MKRNRSLSACPTAQESVAGGVYFIFQLVLLPSILRWVNAQLSQPLTQTELNFTYYLINFLATILIYHEFLGRSARQAIHVLGFIGKYSALELVMAVLQYLPAGLSLAWAYTKSDTIFAPIVIHACINLVAIGGLR